MRTLALVTTLALAAGCAKDLEGASLVDGLRLLGVQAEPPEAQPGDVVSLQAWVVDTHGGSVDVSWSACLLPNNGHVDPACVTSPDGSPGLVPLGSGEALQIIVPAVMRDALGPPDGTDGVYLPIVLHVRAPDDHVDAVYRLRIAGDQPLNSNPVFDTIMGWPPDGTPQPVHRGQTWTVQPRYTPDSSEKYVTPSTQMDHYEFLTTQWFSTGGSFDDPISGGNAYDNFHVDGTLPPAGGVIDVWAVGHDERGGTAITHRTLVMQ